MTTAFFMDERCFWHQGEGYSLTLPVGGLVQPGGGLPESPESKRRLWNLMQVTGLAKSLQVETAAPASREDLLRVHPASYLDQFKSLSDQRGGDLGHAAPFGPGGYEIAALSAGLALEAVLSVLTGRAQNAYALSRPPGHHCLPERPNGFCLLANIGIAVEAALAKGLAGRIAVVDWDVHHGNGTEAIFYHRPEVLTVSLHQERNYPLNKGEFEDQGEGAGLGANLNIPLPPGTGHRGYLAALERLVLPKLARFQPDLIVIACGYDAGAFDPLGRMLLSGESFGAMTRLMLGAAEQLCGGRLVMVHEGGYSETHVPFCGHRVLAELAKAKIGCPDPFQRVIDQRQPSAGFDRYLEAIYSQMESAILT